jgi:gluconolactonase
MTGAATRAAFLGLGFVLAALLSGCAQPQAPEAESTTVDSAAIWTPPVGPRTIGDIERLDPRLDALVAPGTEIELLAEGFDWAEGPVWIPDGEYLLFSDVPVNRIYLWQEGAGHRVWLEPSGYTGEVPRGGEPGSNGLLLDASGRLLLCQHGDRRVASLANPLAVPEPIFATVADHFEGRRFNSPNDLALHSGGAIYFTDPPYGLTEGPGDPNREIDFAGVYRVDRTGQVSLLTSELSRPNGIAFSPDERTLYVANSDPDRAIWMAWVVQPDGTLAVGRVFFDATPWVPERPGLPDGMVIDREGNLFASGPGGVLVFTPEGEHLGTIRTTQATANCTFGEGGRTLFITADSYLLRLRLRS